MIPNGSVARARIGKTPCTIDLGEGETLTFSFVVEVFTKHLQNLRLCFDDQAAAHTLVAQLEALCFISQTKTFAFLNSKLQFTQNRPPGMLDGWNLYNIKAEFKRLGLNDCNWRISAVNAFFSVCESYPTRFIVPFAITDNSESLYHSNRILC